MKGEVKAMTYNSIMVQLDIDVRATPQLTFAWNLAQRFEADLIAFCAAEPRLLLPGDIEDTASTAMVERQVADIEERLEALKSEFDNLVQDNKRTSWRGIVGDPTRHLALHARSADLLIACAGNSGVDRLRTVDPGELILAAGRPVLFPTEGQRPVKGESIVVAWKDAREARRAVVDAMPFLTDARQVVVATIEEDDRAGARDSTADVVRFLMKHGVKARSEVVDVGRGYASEALAEIAVEVGADLMVSGGYGHNRLREWLFGGVTRNLLKDTSTNRFMSN
jgi:nucleotide-binding universal stress UspA family protein